MALCLLRLPVDGLVAFAIAVASVRETSGLFCCNQAAGFGAGAIEQRAGLRIQLPNRRTRPRRNMPRARPLVLRQRLMQVRSDHAGGNGAQYEYGSKEYRRGSRQVGLHPSGVPTV